MDEELKPMFPANPVPVEFPVSEEEALCLLEELVKTQEVLRKGEPSLEQSREHQPAEAPTGTGDVERALQIAVQAHAEQKDKSGEPYIFHPIRVMMRCTSADARVVALLHDVVEDTSVTFEQLAVAGFSRRIVSALRVLTHAPELAYEDYIQKIMDDPIAREVKIADLEDNSDIRRLAEIDDRTVGRLRKYLSAYRLLTAKKDQS